MIKAMSQLFACTFLILLGLNGFAQTKVSFIPEPDQVTRDGKLTGSNVKVSKKGSNKFVVAVLKNHVTYGERSGDLMEKGAAVSVRFMEVKKLNRDAETRRVKLSKLVDAAGNTLKSQTSKALNEAMINYGYSVVGVNSMFDEKEGVAELVIAGEVSHFGFDTKGSGFQVSVLTDWSVFNTSKKKVVYKCATGGYSNSKSGPDIQSEIDLAMVDCLQGLLSDTIFQKLAVINPETKVASGTKELTTLPRIALSMYVGYENMVKGVVGSVVTVKTEFGHGSGFVISKSGFVLTNNHVVTGASDVEVVFDNGFVMQTKVLAANEDRDVALLKISGSGFKPLSINSGGLPPVGTEVIAIGTPTDLSLGQTVTKGIVSGTRELEDDNRKMNNYIQTDVSINPGNSGGPLINDKGEVVGIIVAKVMGSNIEGLGFAIPIQEALEKLNIQFD
ncbi:MAG: trypsin-like peptidase domain-containing protein [Flavobacteriales bacterium]|nr:trypsin-like peptidase domain-containing protein [Flavobacteriales bacterium]